jgi:hypothetical protein
VNNADALLPDGRQREFALEPVTLTGEPVTMVLTLSPGATVRGRLVFDELEAPPRGDLQVRLVRADNGPSIGGGSVTMRPDGTFEATGVAGRRNVEVTGAPSGWLVRHVRLGARDVTDAGFDATPGKTIADLEVVLSRRVPTLTGTARDDRGNAVADYVVAVIGPDPATWYLSSGRFLRRARSNQEGVFRAAGLAPGTYRVLALAGLDADALENPEDVERLRLLGEDVTLGDGETRTLELKLVQP